MAGFVFHFNEKKGQGWFEINQIFFLFGHQTKQLVPQLQLPVGRCGSEGGSAGEGSDQFSNSMSSKPSRVLQAGAVGRAGKWGGQPGFDSNKTANGQGCAPEELSFSCLAVQWG